MQSAEKMPAIKRTRVSSSAEKLVSMELLTSGAELPLVVFPAVVGVDLAEWARLNRSMIDSRLRRHGAILFRGFDLATPQDFERALRGMTDRLIEYKERSSPRSEVAERIYTSTDYPANQRIFPHNEHSYSKVFPLRLFFFCVEPAEQGGETPIADCRTILQELSLTTRERFIAKKWMYVRNFNDGAGLPWQTVFQTSDREAVESYCREHLIEVEWKSGNRLRTRQVRPAIAEHPLTGEMVWFNHATFFHVSTLDRITRDELLAAFKEEDLPNNTYYGDGSRIELSVLAELRAAYLRRLIGFSWQLGDLLMIDNMLAAHSRAPFSGPRQILVAMADPYTRQDI